MRSGHRFVRALTVVALVALVTTTISVHDVAAGDVPQLAGPSMRAVAEQSGRTGRSLLSADKHEKMDSSLAAAARIARTVGRASALGEARQRQIAVVGDRVRVVVEAAPNAPKGRARALIATLGGTVEAEYETLTQALVEPNRLEALAADPGVTRVRLPIPSVPTSITGEGVGASGANAWHAAGFTGAGVKIAVFDGAFLGYQNSLASGDLGPSTATYNFGCPTFENGNLHGTAVAEVVQEMAPSAQLHLMCTGGASLADSVIMSGMAKDQAKALGVQIISRSLIDLHTGRNDGTGGPGTMESVIADARAHGILWVNGAGNSAKGHWHGTFNDTDADFYHNFAPGASPGVDYNRVANALIPPGGSVFAELRWDEWPTTSQDYDLGFYNLNTSTFVASSANRQNGSQSPVEGGIWTNNTGVAVDLAFVIFDYSRANSLPTTTPRIDLLISPGTLSLTHATADGSVASPGDSPHVFTVGAVCWQNDRLESYSSQGPTVDGRIKPDIAGQTNVSDTVATFQSCPANADGTGGVNGTSIAGPHVSGAAALVKGANPTFTVAQLQAFLEGRSVDRGTTGKDNQFGFGVLSLGAVPGTFSCNPRPRVNVSSGIVGGRLQVTVTATGINNLLQSIEFGPSGRPLANALIDLPNGQAGLSSSFTQPIDPPATGYTFWVRRGAAGLATTVPMIVTDGCGTWPTLVGGGTGGGF